MEGIGRYWYALGVSEGIGWHWNVLEGIGLHWKVFGRCGEGGWVLEGIRGYLKPLEVIGGGWSTLSGVVGCWQIFVGA